MTAKDPPLRPPAHRGIALAYAMAAIGVLLTLSLAAVSFFFPMLRNNDAMSRGTVTTRLVRQAAYGLAAESGDSDADGAMESPAFQTSAFAPAGGGALPSGTKAPTTDGWNKPLGYCAWDNGATNSSANRITGDNPAGHNSIVLAVISAGRDHVFQTACSDLKSGTVKGDDIAFWLDQSQVRQVLDGTTYYGDATPSGSFASLNTALIPDGQVRLQSDTNQLMRWNAAQSKWVAIASGSASSSAGRNRNFLINGNFDIWQRGASFSVGTSNIYTADRWGGDVSGTNATYSRITVNPGDTNAPQGAAYALQLAPSTGTTYWELYQPVENLRQFSGQTLTVSFYARNTLYNASTNYTDFTVTLVSAFGSGGSSWVYTTDGKTYTPTATWTKYTVTLTVPDMSGQTFGAAGTDMLELVIAEDMNTGTPNLQFAQVQLEPGNVATQFDLLPPSFEMAMCQRYFESGMDIISDYIPASTVYHRSLLFRMPMRIKPTINVTDAGSYGFTGLPSIANSSADGFDMQWQPNNTSEIKTMAVNWSANAEF